MQEPRAPVHQVDTNPEKLTAPGRVVDWRGAEATLPRVWSRTKGLKLAWTEWRTWRRAVSGVQPPPPPGRSEGGRAGAPGGPHQAERRGSGGTDGDVRGTRSSGPSSAPHPCRTLRPSWGGIEPLLPPSGHTEGLPLTSHSVGLRFSLSEAPGTPLCPEQRGRSGD